MADRFAKDAVRVVANEEVAPGHYATSFGDVQIAHASRPGQFYQIRLLGPGAPFLPRPFSIFDHCLDKIGEIAGFTILYNVVGSGTQALSKLEVGDIVAVTGPLGNTFSIPEAGTRVVLAAGGIGIAPFLAFVKACLAAGIDPADFELMYGARTESLIVAAERFLDMGVKVHFSTDDGSRGLKGHVVNLLEAHVGGDSDRKTVIYASGPTPMLEGVARFCRRSGLVGQMTLEARMICGIGACNSCAVRMVSADDPEGWVYKLVCRDGPVFSAADIYLD